MRLWRISNYADLSGEGGRRASGRWHERGTPAVYLAEHAALALLETLVHLEVDPEDLPSGYQLLEIDLPDDLPVISITRQDLMAERADWPRHPALTRRYGMAWFAARSSAVLKVPSVIMPVGSNYVLNPAHTDASRITIVSVSKAPFDQRLLG